MIFEPVCFHVSSTSVRALNSYCQSQQVSITLEILSVKQQNMANPNAGVIRWDNNNVNHFWSTASCHDGPQITGNTISESAKGEAMKGAIMGQEAGPCVL